MKGACFAGILVLCSRFFLETGINIFAHIVFHIDVSSSRWCIVSGQLRRGKSWSDETTTSSAINEAATESL